ncbi:MAG TPA: adenylyltransferase/cytidyltransferase family protein [Thermomonas sp.]|nr:adenylyltransferase/cytidyltransferase family protein [Thermomonas sp.]
MPAHASPGRPRVVYTRIVADLFHRGHVAYLAAARALGDRLVVYVLDDDHVRAVKRAPILAQADRIAVVAACRHVDAVVASGPRVLTPEYMREQGYDLYALGHADPREAEAKLRTCSALPEAMRVVIPYTEGISSSEIRRRIVAHDDAGTAPA